MKPIVADANLVAFCGLYCGACWRLRKGRCPGCRDNVKAAWCKVRSCCIEQGYASCADCTAHPDPRGCKIFHNPIARVIGFVLRSDRPACIRQIKAEGTQGHATIMAASGRQSLRRGEGGRGTGG